MNTSALPQSRASARYLHPLPAGLQHWLTAFVPSAERTVFRHILTAPVCQTVDISSLAASTGLTTQEAGKALFTLHRRGSIRVDVVLPEISSLPRSWSALAQHMREVAVRADGAGLVLSDPQGLPVASTPGLKADVQQMAAGQTEIDRNKPLYTVELYLDEHPFSLKSHAPLNLEDTGWIDVVRCICDLMLQPEVR